MEITLCRGVRLASVLRPSPSLLSVNYPTTVRCVCRVDSRRWKFSDFESFHYRALRNNHALLSHRVSLTGGLVKHNRSEIGFTKAHYSESKQAPDNNCQDPIPDKKLTVFQKMKQLTKDYWHVLIPVHIVTSIGWTAIFYVAVKNGVDVIGLLEKLNLSEKYLEMLKNSGAGNVAVIYALYKLFTPLRYTVTIGCTTMAIRYLNSLGLLKASSFKLRPIQMARTKKAPEGTKEQSKAGFKGEQPTEPPKT